MSKLYEITEEMKELQAMFDCGDATEEDIADTLEALELEQGQKIEGCLMISQGLIREAGMYEAEITRMKKTVAALNKDSERLLDYVKTNMLATGKDKVDAGLFKVSLRKATVKLGELDESLIPADYFVTIPESRRLDKRLLLSDAKKAQVEGVVLGESARSLTIK